VSSASGPYAGQVVPVDPNDGSVGTPITVGSGPGPLALSEDDALLYAGITGDREIARIDLSTGAVDLRFGLGSGPSGPLAAEDIEVSPGATGTVAVSLQRLSACCAPQHSGVAIFDNGVARPTQTDPFRLANQITFGADETVLYALNTQNSGNDLHTIHVNSSGATVVASLRSAQELLKRSIKFQDGLLFEAGGRVIDPVAPRLLGTFYKDLFLRWDSVEPDVSDGRAYMAEDVLGGGGYRVEALSTQTYRRIGIETFSGAGGDVMELVRWGNAGLAFITKNGELYSFETSMVTDSEPGPSTTQASVTTSTPGTYILTLNQPVQDVVYSPLDDRLYASVAGSANGLGNSLIKVNPHTGAVVGSIFVGSNPHRLGLSADGSHIWVGLGGANSVVRVDVASAAVDQTIDLGYGEFGFTFAGDIEASPVDSELVFVARAPRGSSAFLGIAAFRLGTMLPNTTPGHPNLEAFEPMPDGTALLGTFPCCDTNLYRVGVSASGLAIQDTYDLPVYRPDFALAGTRLYDPSGGNVWEYLPFPSLINTFPSAFLVIPEDLDHLVTVGRLSAGGITTHIVREYNLANSQQGFVSVPTNHEQDAKAVTKWSPDGIAIADWHQLHIIRADVLAPGQDLDDDGADDLNADNCIGVFNPDQADADLDGVGDACEAVGGSVEMIGSSRERASNERMSFGSTINYVVVGVLVALGLVGVILWALVARGGRNGPQRRDADL
jgi:DNA-binding beta-propeller fold protein YncE